MQLPIMMKKGFLYSSLCLSLLCTTTKGQQYNMTGSSEFAVLGEEFTWTCGMFIPSGQTINAVTFIKNSRKCVSIGYVNGDCLTESPNARYSYRCSSESNYTYTLTIPAENMTEEEQGSVWSCAYYGDGNFRSPDVTLNVAMPPSVLPLTNQVSIEGRDLVVTCQASPGNPNLTTFFWTSINDTGFRQHGSTLQLPNVQRTSSGIYRCTAQNIYPNGEKGTHSQDMVVNILYPPSVSSLSQQNIVEGRDVSVTCLAIPGNPNITTFVWTFANDPGFRQNGHTLQISNMQRNSSGTYRCTAENTYSIGGSGTHSQDMVVNVTYKPSIKSKARITVNETERVELTREIDSNPLSDIAWYDGDRRLKTQTSVDTANLTIEHATCTDTKNFTLSVSNSVQRNVTSTVELIVNCKPNPKDDEITFIMTSATRRVTLSTSLIAYPRPRYYLKYENGTTNNEMTVTLSENAINNFTLHCEQQLIKKMDSTTYILEVINILGTSAIFLHILKQGKPTPPTAVQAVCDVRSAMIKWKSSFDGGAEQSFFVVAVGDSHQAPHSDTIADKGENQSHQIVVQFLQPSVSYTFYVFAKNSQGPTISEAVNCTTLKEAQETSDGSHQTSAVVGSVVGTFVVLTIVILLSCFVHRHFTLTCQIGFQKRGKHRGKATDVEDNSLYTVMQDQGGKSKRNPYDVLTPSEVPNQYEAIHMKENQESTAGTYESLNKAESIQSCARDDDNKDSYTPGTCNPKNTEEDSSEEYIYTSVKD